MLVTRPGPCDKCGQPNPIALVVPDVDADTVKRLCWPCYRAAFPLVSAEPPETELHS